MEYLYWVSCIVGFFYVWDRLWWRYQRNLKQKLSEGKQLPVTSSEILPPKPEPTPVQEHWVDLPEGKRVDINGRLPSSYWINLIKRDIGLIDDDGFCFGGRIPLDPVLEVWTSPMQELFQLWRRDLKGFNIKFKDDNNTFTHDKLGISVEIKSHYANSRHHRVELIHNTGLSALELARVITACELYVATKEYQRYLRIKSLSDIRARDRLHTQKEQEMVNFRNAQTNRIREYLGEIR